MSPRTKVQKRGKGSKKMSSPAKKQGVSLSSNMLLALGPGWRVGISAQATYYVDHINKDYPEIFGKRKIFIKNQPTVEAALEKAIAKKYGFDMTKAIKAMSK